MGDRGIRIDWVEPELNRRHTDFQSVASDSQPPTETQVTDCTQRDLPPSLPDSLQNDPDLASVVTAWPTLPEPVKAGILAMVKVASGAKGAAETGAE